MKSSRPQILYLVHRVPFPPNRGDRIRSFHLLDFLSHQADVHLATLADEPVSSETMQALHKRCANVAVEPLNKIRWFRGASSLIRGRSATEGLFWSPGIAAVIRRWAQQTEFDAVVAFCSSMGQYLSQPDLRPLPAIVDLVDVDSEKWLQYAASARGIKRWLYQLEGRRLRSLERKLTARASAVVLVSELEAELWRAISPNDHTYAIYNGVDTNYFRPTISEGRPDRCIFVGALDYPPNVEGVCWFAKHVWPEILGQCPSATFAVVGRNPTSEVCKLANTAGVEVIGSVLDVRPHIADANLAVVPLRIARGLQNKVLEAMACCRPVVASSEALEGLNVLPGENVIEANSPRQWSDEVVRLFKNADERRRLAEAGRSFVLENHDWPTCLAPFNDLVMGFARTIQDCQHA